MRSPELRDRVRIEPPLARDELPALLAGADALLSATQPRGSETLDKVVYEAAACEVPVVASNAALRRVPRQVCPLELSFPPRDAEALADRLVALAAAEPSVRADTGAELRRRVVAGHSVGSWADAVDGDRCAPGTGVSSPRGDQPSEPTELGPRERDVRASRPYLLSRGTARATVRRVLAIAVLAGLDALGLALGLYAALVLRSIVFGDPIFWNLLWEAGPAEWLPFLVPITWLVFWQAGLYAGRERRAGAGRIASSIVLVAAITLAFGWGTNYDFTTSGLIPTACVTSALAIGLLRAAYESMTLELQRLLHVRRRVLLVGDDEHLDSLERVLTVVAAAARVRPRRLVLARARRPAGGAAGAGAAGRDRPQRGRVRRGDRARARRDGAP